MAGRVRQHAECADAHPANHYVSGERGRAVAGRECRDRDVRAASNVRGTAPITPPARRRPGASSRSEHAAVAGEARDARSQASTCGFSVMVQGPPQLTASKFLAFGDSLTYGVISPAVSLLIASVPDSYRPGCKVASCPATANRRRSC